MSNARRFAPIPHCCTTCRTSPTTCANVERFNNSLVNADSEGIAEIEATCLANLENTVRDPVLREKLRPDYRAACKRLIYSPDYYEAIQHPNAELVTDGIECIEPEGVRLEERPPASSSTCWRWPPASMPACSCAR
jgi:hypothetical protein